MRSTVGSPTSRVTAAVLFCVHPLSLMPPSAWGHDHSSEEARRFGHISLPHGFSQAWVPPDPILTPREIRSNKAIPVVASPNFEAPEGKALTQGNIENSLVFDTPIRTTDGKKPTPGELKRVGALMKTFVDARRTDKKDVGSLLKAFVDENPNSGYKTSLLIEAADLEWRQGYFQRSVDTLKRAWVGSRHCTNVDDRRLAEMALGSLLERYGLLGRKIDLKSLLNEVSARPTGGFAANAILRAKDTLWFLENQGESNIYCGFIAANEICVPLGEKAIVPDVQNEEKMQSYILNGLSAFELKQHSQQAGGTLRVVKRAPGAAIAYPAVVHWSFGHYSAITEAADGMYRIADKHLGYDGWMSKEALEQQTSGYFLVPEATVLPAGYTPVADSESAQLFGRFCVKARDTEGDMPTSGGSGGGGGDGADPEQPAAPPEPGASPDVPSANSPPPPDCPRGMAVYSFAMMNPGLVIRDAPVVHTPPYGPRVQFEVTYDQRSPFISDLQNVGNLGPRWTHAYKETIVLSGTGAPNTLVRWQKSNGSYYDYNYNSSNQSYAQRYKERPQMMYISGAYGGPGYQLNFPDGSRKVFKQPNAATPTKYLLTQVVDPVGNAVTLQYDAQLRLVAILDALGQSTTISYTPEAGDNVSSDTFKIRKVTDPFAREAKFKYTTAGQLHKIIDPVGIVSEFRYAAGDFIHQMLTPYGVTEFSHGEIPSMTSGRPGPWVESKDAAGDRERMEANDNALPTTYVANPQAPSSVNVNGANVSFIPKNAALNYRNTFYWNRQQMASGAGDYSKCKIYHWLRSGGDSITAVLASTKDPLVGRVWFNYPNQGSSEMIGNSNRVAKVVRAVESTTGSTVWAMGQTTYNDLGLVTGTIDPQGREMKYEYDANKQDLLAVKVKNGANWETLTTISQYYMIGGMSTHLPEIVTDVSGLQTEYTYNDKGQVTEVTQSKGTHTQTTRYIYDSDLDGNADASGYLLRVEHTSPSNPAQFVTLQSFTYDSVRRVRTITDQQGYTLTYDYDNLDRPTLVTHPDNTTEQLVYQDGTRQTLNVWAAKDRSGRWVRMKYNHLRQMIAQIDSLARLTQYEWCRCGSLKKLINPMGKVTQWKRDGQGRVIEKLLSDGKKYQYTYETLSGRLATVAYPKDVLASQVTYTNRYYLNGQLQKKDYTDASMADVTFSVGDFMGRSTGMTDGIGTYTPSYVSLSGTPNGSGALATMNGPLANDTLRYTYDWLGRMVKNEIVADDGTTVLRSEESVLDSWGRTTQVVNDLGTFTATFNSGNLTGVPDSVALPGGFSTLYSRYAANAGGNALRLQTMHHKQGANTVQKHDYSYELTGNIKTWDRTSSTGNVTSWGLRHDAAGQLVELDETLDSVAQKKQAWHYDAAGNMESLTNVPAGQTGTLQIRSHAGRNQLTQLGGTGKAMVEGTTDEAATVTVNGEPAKVTKLGSSGPWRFERELTFPSGATTINVQATDGASNVTTQNYSLSVSGSADQTLEYDANGNLTQVRDGSSVVTRVCEWDAENRLRAIQTAAAPASGVKRSEFAYDSAGRRVEQVEKEHDGTDWVTVSHWHYLWDGLELAQKRAAADGTVLVNYYGSGEKHGSDSLVYLPDHLGSARAWYRVSDGQVGLAEYGAFGQRQLLAAGPGEPERGYTGHLRDAASGLVLAPYRAYDPQLARWLSEDPIMEAGGLNLYGYVGNGPVMAVDPLGLDFMNLTGEPFYDLAGFNLPGSQDPHTLNILAHGNNISIVDSRSPDGRSKIIYPADMLTLLNGELGENTYTKINFYSCNSGNTSGTGKKSLPYIYPPVAKSFAEKVYDLTGISTSGADGFSFPNADGSELIFREYNSSNGTGWGGFGSRVNYPSK